MKKIYVCSPLRGNIEKNIENARRYCRYVVEEYGYIPIAPHIYFTQFLDDTIKSEREFGMSAGLSLLEDCDELWFFGNKISSGMLAEINEATRLKKPVYPIPEYKYDKYINQRSSEHEMF